MELRTSFNLQENITLWKAELAVDNYMTLDNIDELESHIRDEIFDLQHLGLSEEESFLIASKRLGKAPVLRSEFGKINKGYRFRTSMYDYLFGILMFMAFLTATDLITNFSIIVATKMGFDIYGIQLVSIGSIIFSFLLLFILVYRKFQQNNFMIKNLAQIPLLICVLVFSKLVVFFSDYFIVDTLDIHYFGFKPILSSIKLLCSFIIVVLVFGYFFYSSKKENKIVLVE